MNRIGFAKRMGFKHALFGLACLVVFAPFFLPNGDETIGASKQIEIGAAIISFNLMRSNIEDALRDGKISSEELSRLNEDAGISFSIGKNGEFIDVADNLGIVVVIKPDIKNNAWDCKIFPEPYHSTACDFFPIKMGENAATSKPKRKMSAKVLLSDVGMIIIPLTYFMSFILICVSLVKWGIMIYKNRKKHNAKQNGT
jgi:hypothetical protein